MKRNKNKIGIVGFGNMGSCLGRVLADNGWRVFVYDKNKAKYTSGKKILFCKTEEELFTRASVIIIAVKPQEIKELIDKYKEMISADEHLLISIAAGVSTSFFEKRIKGIHVIRVMPNLAARKGFSLTFITGGKFSTSCDCAIAANVFNCVGESMPIEERFMDKVTAVTGSGPGYVFYFMECLYKSAFALGFDKTTAKKMIQQTFWGALNLITDSDDEFGLWIKRVASKGGTTQAALTVWEKAKCKKLVERGVRAAVKRAKELNVKK